jgi:hypothetical protein
MQPIYKCENNKVVRLLMFLSGFAGVSLFIFANLNPQEGYWFGISQLFINLIVFVIWFNFFLQIETGFLKGLVFLGALIPLAMATITIFHVIV